MAQVSSSYTLLGGTAMSGLVEVIDWGLSGFNKPAPASLAVLISTALAWLGHVLYNIAKSRAAKDPLAAAVVDAVETPPPLSQ